MMNEVRVMLCVVGVVVFVSCVSFVEAVKIVDGDDWSVPLWVTPSEGGGFYSQNENKTLGINAHTFDLTWAMLNPAKDVYFTNLTGGADGNIFDTFANQNRTKSSFWMRLYASSATSMPQWVKDFCKVEPIGVDYNGNEQLPIWDTCVWNQLLKVYRKFFIDYKLRSDPRLKFVYVPGAFTYTEFDFEMIVSAADNHNLTWPVFRSWFNRMIRDLVNIFNGENDNPHDDYSYKLVYTGEDYPFGPDSWPNAMNYLAYDAVAGGMGIRTGITEEFNYHLNEVPAYGIHINGDGYLIVDDSWAAQDDTKRIFGCENECYTDCGCEIAPEDVYYAIKMSHIKALQMGMNWMYVVPSASHMNTYPELYNWVRMSLGKRCPDAFDAWSALRDAEDTYWEVHYNLGKRWKGYPYVKNLERLLYQRDVSPNGITKRGSFVRSAIADPENGEAYEGRSTDIATNNTFIYFNVDDKFIRYHADPIELKITYLDNGTSTWKVDYYNQHGDLVSTQSVNTTNTHLFKTATFAISDAAFTGRLPKNMDFRICNTGRQDIEIYFVRVIKTQRSN